MSNKIPASTPPLTSDEANAVLDNLHTELVKLETRRDGILKSREEVAGGAIIDGKADAKAALAELNAASVSVAVDIENMQAACRAAELRLSEAEAREAAAHEFAMAKLVREVLVKRQESAAMAQEALVIFNQAMEQIVRMGRDLQRCTDKATSDRHIGMALRAAQQNARCDLFSRSLISSEPLPPEELRAPLTGIIEHLDAPAARWADQVIYGTAEAGAHTSETLN